MNLTGQEPYQKHTTRCRLSVNDDAYCAFLHTLRSAFSGKHQNIVSAHFRTAQNSGIAIKPLFHAIPLTDAEHKEQHRIGTFKFAARSWWIAQVRKHQQLFIAQGGVIPEKYLMREAC